MCKPQSHYSLISQVWCLSSKTGTLFTYSNHEDDLLAIHSLRFSDPPGRHVGNDLDAPGTPSSYSSRARTSRNNIPEMSRPPPRPLLRPCRSIRGIPHQSTATLSPHGTRLPVRQPRDSGTEPSHMGWNGQLRLRRQAGNAGRVAIDIEVAAMGAEDGREGHRLRHRKWERPALDARRESGHISERDIL